MAELMTIGSVARLTGLSARTIRFYEEGGYIPPAERKESGYRKYAQSDVRRLKLVRLARLLGLPLAEIKSLVEQAFSTDCVTFASELTAVFDKQQVAIEARVEELRFLSRELDELKAHIEHCDCEPGRTLADCEYCSVLAVVEA